MKFNMKSVPHLVAAALLVVGGIFLYSYVTDDGYFLPTAPSSSLNEPVEYGFRPYGVAVFIIGAAYFIFSAYKATQKSPE